MGKYFSVRKNRRQTRLIIHLLYYGYSGSFSFLFIALCSSSVVAVYLTSEFLGFASCLHSLGIHLPRLYR